MRKIFASIAASAVAVAAIVAYPQANAANPDWNTSGDYVFQMEYGGSNYAHDVHLVQDGSGNLTGTGGHPAGGPYNYTWVIDSGSVSGNAINFVAHYTSGSDAVTPLTVMNVTGTIGMDGTMGGTWNDNYQGGTRSGSWMTSAGTADSLETNTTKVVTGSNNQGWLFNVDPSTQTPYNFTNAQHSLGAGSLFVPAIGANASDKFIAILPSTSLVSDLDSFSYDFMIAGNGTAASANQFYLNVYTNLSGSSTYYDCRFDYVPSTGSTAAFTNFSVNPSTTPVNVGDKAGDGFTCPATLAGMPAGSKINAFAINVGDTSASDTGLAGYLDNAVLNLNSGTTTYDFELNAPVENTVNVTIVKYVDGAVATATSANNAAFPMTATWDATNIGAGTGSYTLSNVGFNNPTAYYATTSEMSEGADYTTSEVTGGPIVAASCSTGTQPFALVGYKTGATLALAQAATMTATAPVLTDLQDDAYVIVLNQKCVHGPVLVGPPTNKDQCKNDGWKTFNNPAFKNQGQCVSSTVKK